MILLLVLIVLTLLLNVILSYRSSSGTIVAQNDSLIQAFEEFRTTLRERERSLTSDRVPREKGRLRADRDQREEPVRREASAASTYAGDEEERYERAAGARYNSFPLSEKLTAGQTISLNETDTTRWKMIPGIGSSYASRIVKYRELLGGYVRMEQLLEVYGMDNDFYARISPYIAPGGSCRKLMVNRAEFSELLRHPYLNYMQVKVIVNLRQRKGNIVSINELAMLDEFTADDIWRLEPYLAF